MIHLVYGGSSSGKSAYAEKLVTNLNTQKKYYVATMKISGNEGLEKVRRHKELRKGKGFETLERETLDALPALGTVIQKKDSTLLLECLSNLVANEMFSENKIRSVNDVEKKVVDDFLLLRNVTENLVIVSNNIFDDGVEYDETTKNYMKALGKINSFVAEQADKVTEVVCGIPLEIK